MSAPKRVCVLTSGGLDSCVLAADLAARGFEVHPLYVREGLRWERTEEYWLRRFLRRAGRPGIGTLSIASVPMAGLLGKHWSLGGPGVPPAGSRWDSVYLPGRNLVLLGCAGVFCLQRGIHEIALATLKGNPFKDARPAFRRAMEAALRLGLGRGIRVSAPYADLTKRQVLARGKGLPLELTFSCLHPRGRRPCRRCSKCEEREALGL